jgi:uncharacterized repeat protein (TIGR01451 family)
MACDPGVWRFWNHGVPMRVIRLSAPAVVAAAATLLFSAPASAAPRTVSDCVVGSTCGYADLQLSATVSSTQAQVGDSLTWHLTVNDYNTQPALNVYVDVTLPANTQLTSTYTDRGTGCTATSTTTLHCFLDWLADTAQYGNVTIVTQVTGTGDHTLTAVTGYSSPSGPVADPNPGNNTVTVTSTTPTPPPPPPPVRPVIENAVLLPGPFAGARATIGFWVTRSDNGADLTTGGTMAGRVSVAGRPLKTAKRFKGGYAYLTFVIPKTAKGKLLKVKLTIKANGRSATKIAKFRVE